MQRELTSFQRKYWDADRLAILRRRWPTFDAAEAICAALNRTSAATLLPVSAYACRQMAAQLRIKRPPGYISVARIRHFVAGTPGAPRRIELAIADAKRTAKREKDRRQRLDKCKKALQEQQVAVDKIAPPPMQKPAWLQPDAPAPKPKRRRGRPFSMQEIRSKDAAQRTVLERASRAKISTMFMQMKGQT